MTIRPNELLIDTVYIMNINSIPMKNRQKFKEQLDNYKKNPPQRFAQGKEDIINFFKEVVNSFKD